MRERIARNLVLLIFFLFGCGVFGLGCYWAVLGKMSRSWEPVQGLLLKAEEIHSNVKGREVTGASVTYTYQYNGSNFGGSRLSFGGSGSDQLKKIQSTAVAQEVIVYVDQDKPDRSVLVPGRMRGSIVLMILGGVWVGFMVFMFVTVGRKRATDT